MSLNILAILLSFAMMLTGAGGEGQPAQAARTLYLHNVSVTYNDQTVELTPALKLGASTDGEKAVFDLGVELGDETLFPTQIGVSEEGLTALFTNSDIAATVTANALESLTEQASQAMANVSFGDEESAELMSFLTDEFLPAYMGLLEIASDEELAREIEAKGNAIFDEMIDRGEGTPVTATVFGEEYALTEYRYTIDVAQMAALTDAVYASNEVLSNYSQALFKLYDMMPEESGLNGMHSFADVFEKTGMDMTMDIVEQRSDDGEVDVTTATLTLDVSGMVAAKAASQTVDGGTSEVPEIAPIVMNIQSVQVGERKEATVDCDYDVENICMAIVVNAASEGLDNMDMDMSMKISQDDQNIGLLTMDVHTQADEATGEGSYAISYYFDAAGQAVVDFSANGTCAADGASQNSIAIAAVSEGQRFALSFDLDVLTDAIEDKANGHEAAVVIDDISEEGMAALGEDQTVQAAMMQVLGSMSMDAQKLMADESIGQLAALFVPTEEPEVEEAEAGIVVDDAADAEAEPAEYADETFTGDEAYEVEVDDDFEYTEPEDDGELPFQVPELTWLPEGWKVESVDVDTAYDTVTMYLTGAERFENGYVICYSDMDDNTVNYQVTEDGDIEPVEGREISLSDYGNGSVSVTLREAGVWFNLSIDGENLDVETIGKIVAGIQF